jgi:hypothetical protein
LSVNVVTVKEYGARLRLGYEGMTSTTRRALFKAALIGEGIVSAKTPVDRGQLRNAWKVIPTSDGAELFNDAPHAGIIELGSRPHRPPFRPILEWVVRVFGTGKKSFEDYSEVDSHLFGIANAIIKKIEAEGTKPRYMVRDSLPMLTKIAKREVEKALSRTDW